MTQIKAEGSKVKVKHSKLDIHVHLWHWQLQSDYLQTC